MKINIARLFVYPPETASDRARFAYTDGDGNLIPVVEDSKIDEVYELNRNEEWVLTHRSCLEPGVDIL